MKSICTVRDLFVSRSVDYTIQHKIKLGIKNL